MQILKILIVILIFINSSTAQQAFSAKNISQEALKLTEKKVVYDGSYYSIPYPNGDVPDGIGVCTDVIVRTFRSFNFDLQKEIHEDMTNNFNSYPKKWGLTKPDPNIDHRRVPNLMTYFKRQGAELQISKKSTNYLPGDIVAWDLGGGITHIGIVVDIPSINANQYQIVHNIGSGQVIEDCLFDFKIIGHYRFNRK